MKIAPIIHEILNRSKQGADICYRLVHTGQHYDPKLSDQFFIDLEIPQPHINLEVGSGSHAEQTGNIMIAFEQYLNQFETDLVLVVGDVNSTLACSIVAKKRGIKVAHVEAGIRSFDLSMPEEVNRMVTDSITDYFFTTSEFANTNLLKAGIPEERIFLVGNTMIDSLVANSSKFTKPDFYDEFDLKKGEYILLTMHRPANVDNGSEFSKLMSKITESFSCPIIFPVHPRTLKQMNQVGLPNHLRLVESQGYLQFMFLMMNAKGVITDSGGIQEETTYLNVPCLTIRDNTERPETISKGTNELLGTNPKDFDSYFETLKSGNWKKGSVPELWDGHTSKRICDVLLSLKS